MKHKHFKHLFTALMLLCAITVNAHDFEVDGIYYNILSEADKTIAVTCKGNYSTDYEEYKGDIILQSEVTYGGITYNVTSIADQAFEYCVNLQSITIPSSIKSIGYRSFENCQSLHTVNLSEGLVSIGVCAFQYCVMLKSIVIPSSVTSVDNYAFRDCQKLESVKFCAKVAPKITNSVFSGISSNAILYYPSGSDYSGWISYFASKEEFTTTITGSCGDNINWVYNEGVLTIFGSGKMNNFSYDSLPSWHEYKSKIHTVIIKEGITNIGALAFANCTSLTSIKIPNSIISIGYRAFYGCYRLVSINILKNVTSIGAESFANCTSLQVVRIDNSTISFGSDAFLGCSQLADVSITDMVAWCYNDFYNFNSNPLHYGADLSLNGENVENLVIPDGVTTISEYAFAGCKSLRMVTIPNCITSIGNSAFYNCELTSVTSLIPSKQLFTIGSHVFYNLEGPGTLYVPYGAKETYASTGGWTWFKNIVELGLTVTINQYGNATYCSPYALDFSDVEGLKAYAATGYDTATQVVTLTRVQSIKGGTGLFLKAEPGEYVIPVIENSSYNTLNLLVGTLEQTTVNSTAGEMSNYKFTIADGDAAPMFYPFEDNTTFSAGKAYLQIPTAWLPATAQKSLSIRFDDGETTDIDEVKEQRAESKDVYYDLSGRVVENPTRGIYIIDGKKVLVK